MKLSEYSKLDATGLAQLIRSKQVSPEEVLEVAIKALEETDKSLNAVVDYTYDYAMKQIKAGIDFSSPFCGVPFAIKDCGGVSADIRATMGTRLSGPGVYANADSTLFTRFKKAGIIVVATSATSEMCIDSTTETLRHSATRNPWNPEFSTGGSSGGAAALVAAGCLPIAHGNDGGGSIRIPASMCGVVGLKPSRFCVPNGPGGWDPGGTGSFILSRTVRDSAIMLDAVEGPEPGSYGAAAVHDTPYAQIIKSDPRKLKIAYMLHTPYGKEFCDSECAQAVLDVVDTLRGLGHECIEAYPEIQESYQDARVACMCDEIAVEIEELAIETGLPIDETTLEPLVYKTYIESLKRMGMDVYKARSELGVAARAMGRFFEDYDILISPTVGKISRKIGTLNGVVNASEISAYEWALRRREYSCITPLANIVGLPSISLPLYMSQSGMPLGIELDGKIDDDQLVLQLAAQLERAKPWNEKRPQIYVD